MISATAIGAGASVAFNPPTYDGGAAITSYEAGCGSGLATGTGMQSPVTVQGLSVGAFVTCHVRAINMVGPGAWSEYSTPVTTFTPPNSRLYLRSQPGDPIGGGRRQLYEPAMGFDFMPTSPYAQIQSMAWTVRTPAGDSPLGDLWGMGFAAVSGFSLQAGQYPDAVNPRTIWMNAPELAFGGNFTYCSANGQFNILDLVRGPAGHIVSLAVDFTQRCTNQRAATFGQFRYNSSVPVDQVSRTIDPRDFASEQGVPFDVLYESIPVTITGNDVAVPVTVSSGGEYRIDDGPFTSAPGTISAGQTLRARIRSASTYNALVTATVDVGGVPVLFRVATPLTAPFTSTSKLQPNGAFLAVLLSQTGVGGSGRPYSPANLSTLVPSSDPATGETVLAVSTLTPWDTKIHGSVPALTIKARVPGASGYLVPGSYSVSATVGAQTASLLIDGHDGQICTASGDGTLIVHEAEWLPNGIHTKLAMDFVENCVETSTGIRRRLGFVRLNSTWPIDYSIVRPLPFSFAPVQDAMPSSTVVSAPTTVMGINVASPISITGGEYSVAGEPFTSAAGTIQPAQEVRVRLTASAGYLATATATLSIGGVNAEFAVVTGAMDSNPDGFTLGGLVDGPRNAWVYSPSMLLSGFNAPANVNITGGEFSIDASPFSSVPGVILPGQRVVFRVKLSSQFATTTSATVQVGNQSAVLSVTTLAGKFLNVNVGGNGLVVSDVGGISCTQSCSTPFDPNSQVKLTAIPSPGSAFLGWSGADCAGIGACTIYMTSSKVVSATFGQLVPNPPIITNVFPGDGQAIVAFMPPPNTGPGPIAYTATCNPGAHSATGTMSPLTVSGLVNGTTYGCTVNATNATGTGPPSNDAIDVTPPLALISVQSRLVHGGIGPFDLQIKTGVPVTGTITVDPRWETSASGGRAVVFSFSNEILALNSISVTNNLGLPVGMPDYLILSNKVIVALGDVLDGTRVTVAIAGVNGNVNASVSFGVLVGDVDGSGVVDNADISAVKSRAGLLVATELARYDVNISGMISAADIAAVKARRGRALP